MKVLVVDDHPLIRDGVRLLIRKLETDAEILEAQTGEEALEYAAANPDLDLVLLDVGLPGMDGLVALRRFPERHLQSLWSCSRQPTIGRTSFKLRAKVLPIEEPLIKSFTARVSTRRAG